MHADAEPSERSPRKEGAWLRCALCRDGLPGSARACLDCGALFHADCWGELDACLGCAGDLRAAETRWPTPTERYTHRLNAQFTGPVRWALAVCGTLGTAVGLAVGLAVYLDPPTTGDPPTLQRVLALTLQGMMIGGFLGAMVGSIVGEVLGPRPGTE